MWFLSRKVTAAQAQTLLPIISWWVQKELSPGQTIIETDMAIELSSEDTFTLTEIGYASVMYGLDVDVEPIFSALNQLYPDNTAGSIGNAITFLHRGNYDEAIEILQNCLHQCSTNTEEAKAILMLAMHMGGRSEEAESLASEVDGEAGIANTMAHSLFTENQQS